MARGGPDHRNRLDTNNPGDRLRNQPDNSGRGGAHKKHPLVGYLKNEDGIAIIETLLTLPVLIFLLLAGVEYWAVLTIHQHAESLKYHTLSRMEMDGGLTSTEKQNLNDKLIQLGADPATIRITGDILENGQQPKYWPDETYLRVEFTPLNFNNFMARTIIGGSPGALIKLGVEGSVVSQLLTGKGEPDGEGFGGWGHSGDLTIHFKYGNGG